MDNNIGNIKPSPTGGLKLMTVFVVVLGLHVLVISIICVYYVLKSPSADADQLTDKTHARTDSALTGGQLPTDPSATTAMSPMPPPSAVDSTLGAPLPVTGTDMVSAPDSTSLTSTAPAAPTPSATETSTPVATAATPGQSDLRTGTAPVGITPPPSSAITTPAAPTAPTGTEIASTAPTPAPTSGMTPVTAPTTSPDLAPPLDTPPYVVKKRDTLAKIAHDNHVTVAKLKEANSLKSNVLHAGQKLVIPAKAPAIATTTITPDASAAAAATTGVTAPVDTIPAHKSPAIAGKTPARIASGAKSAKSASTAVASTATTSRHHIYTVVKGDTLSKIAHEFKTTPSALMAANGISDPTKLSIGKKLKIPSGETRSTKITETPVTRPSVVQPTIAPAPVKTAVTAPVLKDLGDGPASAQPSTTTTGTPTDTTPDADDLLKPKTDQTSSDVAIFP